MRFVIATVVFCAFLVPTASADSSTTATQTLETKSLLGNKRFQEDKRITDIELKAQAGSLSRYSLKFDLSYSGPPVDNLSDPEMPNPDNRPRNNRTSLAGYMGARYRVNSNEAWNLSTGLKWFSPYHQMAGEHVEKRPGEKDYEFANPMLAYDLTYPFYQSQMRSSIKGSYTTADYYLERGQRGSIGFTQALKYTVLQSRWILGISADADIYYFEREYRRGDGRISNYYLSFFPSVEYRLRDSLNFKTSLAYSYANMRLRGSWWKWDQQAITQRVGVGWAIARDIYLNPYLNFFTENPAIRTTSLSFSTIFSIF